VGVLVHPVELGSSHGKVFDPDAHHTLLCLEVPIIGAVHGVLAEGMDAGVTQNEVALDFLPAEAGSHQRQVIGQLRLCEFLPVPREIDAHGGLVLSRRSM